MNKRIRKKIKVHMINIDHWFETKKDAEIYRKFHFPQCTTQDQATKQPNPPTLWIDEAIAYLGLDRISLKRPDKAIHRLINKGALHPQKVSGRLVFSREELEKVLANGDHKRGKGRPRKL